MSSSLSNKMRTGLTAHLDSTHDDSTTTTLERRRRDADWPGPPPAPAAAAAVATAAAALASAVCARRLRVAMGLAAAQASRYTPKMRQTDATDRIVASDGSRSWRTACRYCRRFCLQDTRLRGYPAGYPVGRLRRPYSRLTARRLLTVASCGWCRERRRVAGAPSFSPPAAIEGKQASSISLLNYSAWIPRSFSYQRFKSFLSSIQFNCFFPRFQVR